MKRTDPAYSVSSSSSPLSPTNSTSNTSVEPGAIKSLTARFPYAISGAIVNSSRGIAFAYREANTTDWRSAADRAMDEMLEGLRGALA